MKADGADMAAERNGDPEAGSWVGKYPCKEHYCSKWRNPSRVCDLDNSIVLMLNILNFIRKCTVAM